MGLVHHEHRAMGAGQRRQFSQRGEIAIHGIERFRHDPWGASGVIAAPLRQGIGEAIDIVVGNQPVAGAGQAQALMHRGVDQLVDEDHVLALGHGGQQGGIGGEAGGQEQGALATKEAGRLGLQRLVLGIIAAQQARAARADGHAARQRRARRFGQRRVGGKAEIIVGGEIRAKARGQGAQASALRQPGEILALIGERRLAHARLPNRALPTRTWVAPS